MTWAEVKEVEAFKWEVRQWDLLVIVWSCEGRIQDNWPGA